MQPGPYSPAPEVRPYGKYLLLRKIAEGGMAEIFLAKQVGAEGFERNVVIKRMLPHLSSVSDFVDMFLDEARLAARLGHQNIVQINDLGFAEGYYFICMEYLAGEDFSAILRAAAKRGQYVPLNVAARIIIEAAHGLHFAHEFTDEGGKPVNIVHRDISPSNIFVTYEGQVKVLDFGIAKAESRVTQTNTGVVKGKYMYMAPEQAGNQPIDRRADVFSLGVSLYESVTNVRPFARENDLAILNAVLKGEFHPPRHVRPELPKDLEDIVLKSMQVRPEDRYQTAAELAADLGKYLGSTTSATGVDVIGQYVRSVVGPERVSAKTRIPSWSAITKEGKAPAPWNPENIPSEGRPRRDPLAATAVIRTRPHAPRSRRMRRLNAVSAGLIAFTLGAAGVAAWQSVRRAPSGSEPTVDAGAVAIRIVTSDPAPPTVGDAQQAERSISPPTQSPRPKPPVEPTRARLTPAEIRKVVSKGQVPIMRCFEQHKEDLTQETGEVTVKFTIQSTGRVLDAVVTSGEVGAPVKECLVAQMAALRFPPHKDKEVTLSVPFAYRVRR